MNSNRNPPSARQNASQRRSPRRRRDIPGARAERAAAREQERQELENARNRLREAQEADMAWTEHRMDIENWEKYRIETSLPATDSSHDPQLSAEYQRKSIGDAKGSKKTALKVHNLVVDFRDGHIRPTAIANDKQWHYKKKLGKGEFGLVTLYEYHDIDGVVVDNVAVKYSLQRQGFGEEAQLLKDLGQHDHINCAKEGLDLTAKWLYLEYCENGNLSSLLDRRTAMNRPFHEITLWGFFQCLVRGLSVLDHGDDDPNHYRLPDELVDRHEQPDPTTLNTFSITHGDLKPDNILVAGEHEHTGGLTQLPQLKIADFGNARQLTHKNFFVDMADRQNTRHWGTKGYFPPESFSKDWDAVGPDEPPVSFLGREFGRWGTWSNIWVIGAIMLRLMGNPKCPDVSREVIGSDARGKLGMTYGHELFSPERQIYSHHLRELVLKCLMKNISQRISLPELHAAIEEGCALVATLQEPEGMDQIMYWDAQTNQWPWPNAPDIREQMNQNYNQLITRRPKPASYASDDSVVDESTIFSDESEVVESKVSSASEFSQDTNDDGASVQSDHSITSEMRSTKARRKARADRRAEAEAGLAKRRLGRRQKRQIDASIARRVKADRDPKMPEERLLIGLYHKYCSIPSDASDLPDLEQDNHMRLRKVTAVTNQWTLGAFKDRVAMSFIPGGHGLGCLGVKRETMVLHRIDSISGAFVLTDELDGWTLADLRIDYGAVLYVEGDLKEYGLTS